LFDLTSSKRLRLLSLHPGVSLEEVQENSQFEILLPEKIGTSSEPSDGDLELLRREIDPAGIVLGK
jgi:glutaconate CoA-transferase, subunit B